MNLSGARVETFEMDCVAWFDREPWRESAVPAGMCRPSRKIVFGHRVLDFDSHLEFNKRIACQRRNADGGSYVPGSVI